MSRARSWIGVGLFAAVALPVASAAQQDIADIDYTYLSFRGVALEGGYLWPNKVEATQSYGVRFDLGYAGPGLRIVPSVNYWSSRLNDGEITDFETRIANLVADQTGGLPPALDFGSIDYSDLSIGIDAHVVWEVPLDLLTFGGLGLTAHFIDGDGAAIDGTFVEDLIDSVEPGFNLHLGMEYPVTNRMRLYTVGRYEVMPELQYFQIRVGWQIMWGENEPGEGRGND